MSAINHRLLTFHLPICDLSLFSGMACPHRLDYRPDLNNPISQLAHPIESGTDLSVQKSTSDSFALLTPVSGEHGAAHTVSIGWPGGKLESVFPESGDGGFSTAWGGSRTPPFVNLYLALRSARFAMRMSDA